MYPGSLLSKIDSPTVCDDDLLVSEILDVRTRKGEGRRLRLDVVRKR